MNFSYKGHYFELYFDLVQRHQIMMQYIAKMNKNHAMLNF